MLLSNARKNSDGFTLIETMTVVMILSILGAIIAPSFLALLNKNKVSNAIDQLQGALQEVQREAIRKSKTCLVSLTSANRPTLSSNCFVIADYTIKTNAAATSGSTTVNVYPLPVDISNNTTLVFSGGATGVVSGNTAKASTSLTLSTGLSTNILSGEIVAFRTLQTGVTMANNISGTNIIKFGIRGNTSFNVNSSTTPPVDSSGKIILYMTDQANLNRKCLAISQGIGIIRIGNYSGPSSLANPNNITDSDTCNASY